MFIVEVWIEHPVRSLDQTYSYLSNVEIPQGCRVSVPFGVKQLTGFSESCTYTEETEEPAAGDTETAPGEQEAVR